jgi:hypothetical protein
VEVFIADQHGEFAVDDFDRGRGVVFLTLGRGTGRKEERAKKRRPVEKGGKNVLKEIYIGCIWRCAIFIEGDAADGLLFHPS